MWKYLQCIQQDDRYFISGALDGKLRLWSIPDKRVVLWNEVGGQPNLITAANFCQVRVKIHLVWFRSCHWFECSEMRLIYKVLDVYHLWYFLVHFDYGWGAADNVLSLKSINFLFFYYLIWHIWREQANDFRRYVIYVISPKNSRFYSRMVNLLS